MGRTVRVPWAAWYGTDPFELDFPDGWDVRVHPMKGGPDIGDAGIRAAFAAPVGSPPLRELARGRSSAAILIDDLSRPTPSHRLLPYILEELDAAGVGRDRVSIIAALAAHRPMTRDDFIKKVGPEIVETMRVLNHDAYENLEFLGYSSRGVPIFVNRDYMATEVRIALGMITPRGGFFGGGAKLLIPGACGQATIMANHRYIHEGFREHLDEVAAIAGLGFIVNPLLNAELEIMALVTGAPAPAFAQGVAYGEDLYRTEVPSGVDVAVFNAFPKDTELLQAPLALVPMAGHPDLIRDGGTAVMCSASPEGLGWHTVLGPGTALAGRPGRPARRTILFSPGINRFDAEAKFGPHVLFCKTWPEVTAELSRVHGPAATVAVFPCGALQYGGR